MHQSIISLVVLGLTAEVALAASIGESQAKSFAETYSSFCVKHAGNFDALREKLKQTTPLSADKAAVFLSGKSGDAWPIPVQQGPLVLTLPRDQSRCSVHMQGVDSKVLTKQFANLVSKAPYPMLAKQVRSDKQQMLDQGGVQTVSYEWSAPNSPHKMVFTLTTDKEKNEPRQAQGSVAILPL